MPRLTEAVARDDCRLFVRFEDGTSGEVDLSSRLFGPMFDSLKDPSYFARVTVDEYGAPTWPNGADLAPDALYRQLTSSK